MALVSIHDPKAYVRGHSLIHSPNAGEERETKVLTYHLGLNDTNAFTAYTTPATECIIKLQLALSLGAVDTHELNNSLKTSSCTIC